VRNPYDRTFSAYLQVRRDIENHWDEKYPEEWIKKLVRAQISENRRRLIGSEYDFNRWIFEIPDREIFDVGKNLCMLLHPSYYWTHFCGADNDQISFIGRVENFEEDFASFCGAMQIKPDTAKSVGVTPVKHYAPKNGYFYKYIGYMSCRTISRINQLFQKDFNLFGYDIADPNSFSSTPLKYTHSDIHRLYKFPRAAKLYYYIRKMSAQCIQRGGRE
jgi:hypothetical protein